MNKVSDLAVYIHWPFCLSKCPYCDFNSKVLTSIDMQQWEDKYLSDLRFYAQKIQDRDVSSIFFGGGTPSLMPADLIRRIIEEIDSIWGVASNCEITLEANPTSVENEKLKAFRDSGVNRVSVGVQSFDEQRLSFLGRTHSDQDAVKAIELAQKYFPKYSFDLIYATQGQTLSSWEEELRAALKWAKGHVSLYQLTIEEKTKFAALYKAGEIDVLSEDLSASLYDLTLDIMEELGFPYYEVSNFAKKNEESVHNLTYWRYGEYIGLGPGAHGRICMDAHKYAVEENKNAKLWLQGKGRIMDVLSPEDRGIEALLMGMRIREGIPLSRIEKETGQSWTKIIDEMRLQTVIEQGFVKKKNGRLKATRSGMQRLNTLLDYIIL